MTTSKPDLVVLYEHPEWQKPLFAALERRGVSYGTFNVVGAAFSNHAAPAFCTENNVVMQTEMG